MSLTAHETPERSAEPSGQQGRGCCSQSKGSQRGRSTAGALAGAVLGELQIFTSPRRVLALKKEQASVQGSWEVWLAQDTGVLSTAQQLRGVTERARHRCTLLCSTPAEL